MPTYQPIVIFLVVLSSTDEAVNSQSTTSKSDSYPCVDSADHYVICKTITTKLGCINEDPVYRKTLKDHCKGSCPNLCDKMECIPDHPSVDCKGRNDSFNSCSPSSNKRNNYDEMMKVCHTYCGCPKLPGKWCLPDDPTSSCQMKQDLLKMCDLPVSDIHDEMVIGCHTTCGCPIIKQSPPPEKFPVPIGVMLPEVCKNVDYWNSCELYSTMCTNSYVAKNCLNTCKCPFFI